MLLCLLSYYEEGQTNYTIVVAHQLGRYVTRVNFVRNFLLGRLYQKLKQQQNGVPPNHHFLHLSIVIIVMSTIAIMIAVMMTVVAPVMMMMMILVVVILIAIVVMMTIIRLNKQAREMIALVI